LWAKKSSLISYRGATSLFPSILVGGDGSDSYFLSAGAFSIIADASTGSGDSLRLFESSSDLTSLFSVEGKHIFFNTRYGTGALVINALSATGAIESVVFSDVSFSTSPSSILGFLDQYKTLPDQTLESLSANGYLNASAADIADFRTISANALNIPSTLRPVLKSLVSSTYSSSNSYAISRLTGTLTGTTTQLTKNSFDYKFYNLGGGRYGVQEKGSSKIDEITGASSLKFADQTLTPANDVAATFNQVKGIDDVSGVVFRLYNAAFSRLPDANGLQNWINGNAAGTVTYASSAQSFSESQEFKNRYGSNVTDTQFITTLYNNVLGRAPDAAGLSHYQSLLAGGRSRGALLLDFSESPENRVLFTQVTGLA
jgi:hypothetical protein